MEGYELLPVAAAVHVNMDEESGSSGHGQQQEKTDNVGGAPTSSPMLIRKKIETIARVDGEVDAFVAAAMGSETEKERVKLTCSTATTDSDSRTRTNSFHFAAKHGFTEVVTRMTAMGFTKLLWDDLDDSNYKSPVEVAVEEKHYDTAEVLLRRMGEERAIKLFKRRGGEKPRISFFKLLNQLVVLQDNEQEALQLQQFLIAVLDTTVSEQEVDLELLEADENGIVPAEETFEKKRGPKTCYSIIVSNNLKMLQKHESFGTLVQKKWTSYGQIARSLSFLFYMVFMTFLTISLVFAAKSPVRYPTDYSSSIEGFRLFCEIITFLLALLNTVLEIKDYIQTYKENKRHTRWDACKARCGSHWIALKEHFQSATNWLDLFALLTLWLIIPFRIADSDWQWVFAAIAYILNGLRIFKHAIMFWSVAVYISILQRIITRDLPQFILVMVVVLIAFGGGVYFALRGETPFSEDESGSGSDDEFDPVDDTGLGLFPDDTREIHLAWLTGLRILTEGSVLDYYGRGEYGLLASFLFWLFVFVVNTILLSLLIAQFSVSFQERKDTAKEDVILTRTELLQTINNLFPTFMLKSLQNINGRIRRITGAKFEPEQLKVKRSHSKVQEDQENLVARQERIEAELYKMQYTVQEINKNVERVLEKIGGGEPRQEESGAAGVKVSVL